LVSDSFVDCLGSLCSVISENASYKIKLLPTDLFPEIRFKKTYGDNWSGDKEDERTLKLKNITKSYKKDFMFEI